MKPLAHNTLFSSLNSSQGQSSIYIVIIIMVVIFAVMFVGGTESLSSGNEASPVSITPSAADSGSASPAAGSSSPSTTTSPTATTAPWTLDVAPGACENSNKGGLKKVQVTISGNSKGYFAVSQLNGESYEVFGTAEFSPPTQNYNVPLINDLKFNTRPWKITVFSSGSKNGVNWEGGFMQKTYDGQATGCN